MRDAPFMRTTLDIDDDGVTPNDAVPDPDTGPNGRMNFPKITGATISGSDTRIVERWTPAENGLTMERTLTVYDKLYTQPITRTRGSARRDECSWSRPTSTA